MAAPGTDKPYFRRQSVVFSIRLFDRNLRLNREDSCRRDGVCDRDNRVQSLPGVLA